MSEIHCRHFSGYKPCNKSEECGVFCKSRSIPQSRVLIVHLGALGAVLRSTSLLPAIKRKYPHSHITWITDKPADQLLKNNKYLDKVYTSDFDSILELSALKFDVVFSIDKSLKVAGITKQLSFDKLYGFTVDPGSGSVLPANREAKYLWELGLSNEKKFFENKKTESQLLIEALCLGEFKRDDYQFELSMFEKEISRSRRHIWGDQGQKTILGINTGCANTITAKRLTVSYQIRLIKEVLKANKAIQVVLLGGKEDTARNLEISKSVEGVILSQTDQGLRDGLCSVDACDIVITGDSLGMHMAIALKKWTVAWFGPTCDHEIDLYDRGMYVKSKMSCSPCWKRDCDKESMCYDEVSMSEFIIGIQKGMKWLKKTSSSKQPLLETQYSPSHY